MSATFSTSLVPKCSVRYPSRSLALMTASRAPSIDKISYDLDFWLTTSETMQSKSFSLRALFLYSLSFPTYWQTANLSIFSRFRPTTLMTLLSDIRNNTRIQLILRQNFVIITTRLPTCFQRYKRSPGPEFRLDNRTI